MKKWLKTLIILVIITGLIVGGVIGYNAIKAKQELTAKYDVYPNIAAADVNDMGYYISSSGNLINADDANVYTMSYGKVLTIDVETGQSVKQGDLLATLDNETLEDDIAALQESIFNKELEINTGVFPDDTHYIKSPIAGEVKDIKVIKDDEDTEADEASYIEDVIDEYGYLALVSSDDLMYIVTEENADFLTVGNEVKVTRFGYEYDAVVDKIEDGKTYVLAQNDNYRIGGDVSIYDDSWSNRVIGVAQLYDYVEITVPVSEGRISNIEVINNESVEKGEVLFKVKLRSQQLIDLYQELDDLKEELAENQAMLENTHIIAPVDGIIKTISIQEEQDAQDEQLAFTLADTSTWMLPVGIDELDINNITEGMTAIVTVDAYEGAEFEGNVIGISSVGVAQGGVTSYEVLVQVNNSDVFKLNMTANVEIEVQFVEKALTVPAEAIREINDKTFVVVYTNPSEQEVNDMKKVMMEAESMIIDNQAAFSKISEEDIAKAKDDSMTKKDNSSISITIGDKNQMGIKTMAVLSIADQLYGRLIPVEVGLINESYAQILSGLEEGEQILLPNNSSTSKDDFGFSGMRAFSGMGK